MRNYISGFRFPVGLAIKQCIRSVIPDSLWFMILHIIALANHPEKSDVRAWSWKPAPVESSNLQSESHSSSVLAFGAWTTRENWDLVQKRARFFSLAIRAKRPRLSIQVNPEVIKKVWFLDSWIGFQRPKDRKDPKFVKNHRFGSKSK